MQDKSQSFTKRRVYLVSRIQLKFVGLILAVSFGVALLNAYVVYYSMMMTMGDKLAKVYPQGMLVGIVKTVNMRILFSMLVVSPIIAFGGIFLSHRIAGPLYRIERYLRSIASGDLSLRLSLRKRDELKNVAGAMNELIDRFKADVKEERESVAAITTDISRIKELSDANVVDKGRLKDALSRINSRAESLQKKLSAYKV